MVNKSPALSTQLKTAQAQIEKLEKDVKSARDTSERHYKDAQDLRQEIEQMHALLDVLPCTPGRKTTPENSWDAKDISSMTRLAAYLANRTV